MLIVGLETLEPFLKQHASARNPMARWTKVTEQGRWQNIIDLRSAFPNADAIKGTNLTCFNIGGNNFRLLTIISYQRQEMLIEELLTHAEYAKKYT